MPPSLIKHLQVIEPGSILLELPIKLISAFNAREHWAVRSRRVRDERQMARFVLARPLSQAGFTREKRQMGHPRSSLAHVIMLHPVRVVMTRISPRILDAKENLPGAFKAIADGVADAFGVADNDERFEWGYGQEKRPKTYGVRIEITKRDDVETEP